MNREEAEAVGRRLVEASRTAEFSAQRRLAATLRPYILDASKRMSARKISKWLAGQGVKLSAVTVAKLLGKGQK